MPVPPHSAPWVSPASTKREDTRRTLFGSSARSQCAKILLMSGRRKTTIAKLSPSLKNSACARSSRIATLVWENYIGDTGNYEKAKTHLANGVAMMREMEMGLWLERAEAELKVLG